MLINVEEPSAEELAAGARDPMSFYTQYGFIALPKTPRTVFKRVSTIEKELAASFNVNFVNDTRFTIPIPTDHHTFEELDAIREHR
jgi:hypothetical protein